MEDIFGPAYEREHVPPQAAFQSCAVGALHRRLFPTISWKKVKDMYYRDTEENHAVSWAWYREHTSLRDELSFSEDLAAWDINLCTLLSTPLHKLQIFKEYMSQPSSGLVFPLIGRQGILMPADSDEVPDNCVVKTYKDTRYIIQTLGSYAESLKNCDIDSYFDFTNRWD